MPQRGKTPGELGVNMGVPGPDASSRGLLQSFHRAPMVARGQQERGRRAARTGANAHARGRAARSTTIGSAWFSFDENKRGSLEPGKLADLAVLSKDYMAVPLADIGGIESLLTMVGGKDRIRRRPIRPPGKQFWEFRALVI